MDRVRRLAPFFMALAFAGRAAGEDARWYLKMDNDVAFGTDRWYTGGSRIARVQDGLEFGIVHEVFTPDAKNWHPGKDDRAPAARLLASAALHGEGAGYFQTIELALGVRGPAALGRQITQAVHHVISAPHVDWSRQLDDRLDAQVAFARSQSVGSERFKVHAGATLGNQLAFAHAGFELRAGDPALCSALLRFVPTPPFTSRRTEGWSAYVGASLRAIGRQEFISRNYDPFGPELNYRHEVGRVAAGVAWLWSWGSLTLDIAQDAKEFDAQTVPQRFGSAAIHVAF